MTNKRNKILITGVSGLLGSNLAYCYKNQHDVMGFYHQHPVDMYGVECHQIDLLDKTLLSHRIKSFDPDVIIHCAAITDIDYAENHKEETTDVNVVATRNIAEAIMGTNTTLIYVSTDSFYDGIKGDYVETDKVHSLHHYGQTKFLGEKEALNHSNTIVARTNIYGWNVQQKNSLAEWVKSSLESNTNIKGFTDVLSCSIYTFKLAELFEQAIEKELTGVYHFVCSNHWSKYQFCCEVADRFALNKGLIDPISVDEFPFTAKRSKNLILKTEKLSNDLEASIVTCEESMDAFFNDFKEGIPEKIKEGLVIQESHL